MYWESVSYEGKRVYIKHRTYYEIGMDNLSKSIDEQEKWENRDSSIGEKAVAAKKVQRHLCISTMFLYLTVESFINFYAAINKIGEREKLERKPTKYKWRRYPRIVTNQEIDNKVIDNLEKLTMRRNELVHYKPMEGAEGIEDPTNITINDCNEYESIVMGLFTALATIDNEVKIDWLQTSKDYYLNKL